MGGPVMAMTQPSFRDSDKWKKGHTGELIIAKILQEGGWYVIPSYDYTGEDDNKAPRLQGIHEQFVIPDLDIAKDGCRLWAEVKTKASASFTRITQRYEHGIPMRHYRHYLKVQEITGCDVWLYVYEEDTRTILRGSIDYLSQFKREYNGDKMSRGGMVFFPRDKFELVMEPEPDEIPFG